MSSTVELTPLIKGSGTARESVSQDDSSVPTASALDTVVASSVTSSHSCDDLRYSIWHCDAQVTYYSNSEVPTDCTNITSSSKLKHRAIADNYDHLEIKQSSDSEDCTHIPPTHASPKSSTTSRYSGSSLSSVHSFIQDQVHQEVVEESEAKSSKIIRRPHVYEDVDMLEDNRHSNSSSPETLERAKQELRYNRKIDLLGHEHNYEYVTAASINSGSHKDSSSRSTTSSPEILSEWKYRDSSVCTSPSREKFVQIQASRKAVCTSGKNVVDDYSKQTRSIPVPSIMTKHANDRPPSVPPKPNRIENNSHTSMPSLTSSIPPKRSVDESRSRQPKDISEVVFSTAREQHSDSTSDCKPSIPPRLPITQPVIGSEPLQNYTEVYIPVSIQKINPKDDKLSISSSTRRKGMGKEQEVNYAEIDHLVTLQLEHMKRERDLEKGLM